MHSLFNSGKFNKNFIMKALEMKLPKIAVFPLIYNDQFNHLTKRNNASDVSVFSLKIQGHPTDLFLTISVLQRKFCWLGTEVSAVLLGSKVFNLWSRIYQMYQKFLLEVFHPSNLLEIFLGCISSWVSGVIGSF